MSEEKQIVNEITIYSGDKDNQKSFELSKWAFRQTTRQLKHIGEALLAVEKATGKQNLLSNIDIAGDLPAFMIHADEHVVKILRNSLPKGWVEDEKDKFIDNMSLVQGIRFLKAVIKLNFLDEEIQAEVIGLLSGDLSVNENS